VARKVRKPKKKPSAKKVTLKPTKKGQKPITFQRGGEHKSLGVPAGEKIPANLLRQAKGGKLGRKAQKQEIFRENVLTGPKRRKDRKKKVS
jgi:hypothetical protein